jgi:hypothetical protein
MEEMRKLGDEIAAIDGDLAELDAAIKRFPDAHAQLPARLRARGQG